MKLAVSNIAWTNEEEPAVVELLRKLNVQFVEVAPTKKWQDPTTAGAAEVEAYKSFWKESGLEIVAFQSMLFNRPDLKIFADKTNKQETLDYLQNFIGLANSLGAGVMVFGSPKNRQRGGIDLDAAMPIAEDFFTRLGQTAHENNLQFCIEPNASQYACDFVTTAQEGIDFVRKVDTAGFGLHLDIACMTLAGDDVTVSITKAGSLMKHFHISSPMLESVEDRPDVHHREAAAALRAINYDGYVSIEMKPAAFGENVARVEKAVRFAQSVYGG